jgi:NAD(P)-dependent dehydrogenase (short-subunit alcohol dehydrogenase family)
MAQPKEHPGQQLPTRPGKQHQMQEQPKSLDSSYQGSNKLKGKVALVTGGDSGIGRAVALAFAAEGASVVINYLEETKDAKDTKQAIEDSGADAWAIAGDVGDPAFAAKLVQETVVKAGGLDIVVNNAAEQHPQKSILDITPEQLERTFRTNIFAMFYVVQAALPHLKEGSAIINTTSVTAYKGSPELLDYSSTKGAITAFTYSLSEALVPKGIRVNAVAPGPIWTPLIPSTFPAEKVKKFGQDVPMKRSGEPAELAGAYVYLASKDSSYVSGQVLHVNGGTIVHG